MQSLCVYCGSSPGVRPVYQGAALELARVFVARGVRLVYGGASVGLMGILADEILRLGGHAVGVIPESLVKKEVAHHALTELHVTKSMHERKTLMFELADGFIALPGGMGTLEELFEVWTWSQLGLHQKPCGILNADGYYDDLLKFLGHAVAEKFIAPKYRALLLVHVDPEALLDQFAAFTPPPAERPWIRPDQR